MSTNPETPSQTIANHGEWASPISSDYIAASAVRLGQLQVTADAVYWTELRPSDGGRTVLVRSDGTATQLAVPPWFNVRTRVHEYGGGAFLVTDDAIIAVHDDDQRLYRISGETATPLTADDGLRYADMIVDHRRRRLIAVTEEHQPDGGVVNRLATIALDGGENAARTLVEGHDFYASPRLSPDGRKLCWLSWNLPRMPWDGTTLFVADVGEQGELTAIRAIAGNKHEALAQPEWLNNDELIYVSDRDNWWNLYLFDGHHHRPLAPREAEFSFPMWQFGMSSYAPLDAQRIVATYTESGRWHLGLLEIASGDLTPLALPYTEFSQVRATAKAIVCVAGAPSESARVISIDPTTGTPRVLHESTATEIDTGYLATPQHIAFPTRDGTESYAWYYRPTNPAFRAPEDQLPPLLVKSHGGPTGATSTLLDWRIQFWTSRGFAVLDVNYRGSTGYGRPYRQMLQHRWGEIDVSDCIDGAEYLVARGDVDPARLAIAGSSAGGYTTLCALTFHDCFSAGASYYGVSDIEALMVDTHKFESRYDHFLIGEYPAEQEKYRARSPIHFAEHLSCPVIFFQGEDDKVVPPNQAERMVAVLREKNLPVEYVLFAGEGHGFRRAENIKMAMDRELAFYGRVFAFEPSN